MREFFKPTKGKFILASIFFLVLNFTMLPVMVLRLTCEFCPLMRLDDPFFHDWSLAEYFMRHTLEVPYGWHYHAFDRSALIKYLPLILIFLLLAYLFSCILGFFARKFSKQKKNRKR